MTTLIIYSILSFFIACYLAAVFYMKQVKKYKAYTPLATIAAFIIYLVLWPFLFTIMLYNIKKIKEEEDL